MQDMNDQSLSAMPAQGFQRVSDNIGNDAPATRDRFEAIVKSCAKSASLDSSFQESEVAAANGHSSSCPETKARTPHFHDGLAGKSSTHNPIIARRVRTC